MTELTAQARYDSISERFFDTLYTFWPPHATRQGLHQYDHSLGHYRRSEVEGTLRTMQALQNELAAIRREDLDAVHALDYPVLATRMKREIFWIDGWRFWQRSPLFYLDIIVEGLFNLVSREFAPAEERLAAAVSRLRAVPEVLAAARENLSHPPVEYTRLALDQMGGAVAFVERLADSFAGVEADRLKEVRAAGNRAASALREYEVFLREDLLARSDGKFAIGADGVQALLDAEEMIDVPVAEILDRLYHDLETVNGQIVALADHIAPGMTVDQVIERMRAVHAAPEALKASLEVECRRIRASLVAHDFLTIPPEMPDVIVQAMPDYADGGGAMRTPGPFEMVAQESYLQLQIPKPSWTPERFQGLWSDLNHYGLVLLVIHECYPGHHTQFYLQKRVPLRASRDHDSDSNSDGWAEYAKFTFVEQVLAPADPFYQFAALLSKRSYIAAGIAGLEIHLEKRSLEQASDFLMKWQGRTRENTFIWVLNRATHYPTHLTYYIGSEMVRKLREDYRSLRGPDFSLKEFHDRFMSYGLIPIRVIRQDMLGSTDDGVLF